MNPAGLSRWLLSLGLALTALHAIQAPSAAPDPPPGEGLFTNRPLPRLIIELPPDSMRILRESPRQFVAATLREDGQTHPGVAVHLKGSVGSFRPLDDRPAFTLDFCELPGGRKFHGLRRIHLNNSVEDPACVNERLGSEFFNAAGVPAPRVTRAMVTLNGRALGIYVLKEGFTEDFLAGHFHTISGDLFEPEDGHDVDERFKRNSVRAPSSGRTALKALAEAVQTPDLAARWKRLEATLDTDRFARFLAGEVILAHRDGYSLARNNFRVYHDLDSGRMVFLPHGMDQLLGLTNLPWQPHWSGLAARAFMETTQGRALYDRAFRSLLTNLFDPERLAGRVDALAEEARPCLSRAEWLVLRQESDLVKARLRARRADLDGQLAVPEPRPPLFMDGRATLSGWEPSGARPGTRMEVCPGPGGNPSLHVVAAGGETSVSWRTRAWLPPGHYRFEGRCATANITLLSFGNHQGAGLRIGGQPREMPDQVGNTDWRTLAATVRIEGKAREIELICEFRAAAGEAWFDTNSLVLRHLSP